MWKHALHMGSCQRDERRHRSAQHGPLVVKETGKTTYRPRLKPARPGVHKAVKQRGAIFNYASSCRTHTFPGPPQAASHPQSSPSWPISIDKKPRIPVPHCPAELTGTYLLPRSNFCCLEMMRVSMYLLFLG